MRTELIRSPLLNKWDVNELRYSFVWEDWRCLAETLATMNRAPRRILSIGSSGDNALSMLLNEPEELTILDLSPAQITATEMKMNAIAAFSFQEYIEFFWDQRHLHARGRLDRYFEKFRREALPHLWAADEITAMANTKDLNLQREIFARADQNLLRKLASEFFSKSALSAQGRDSSQFAYVEAENIGPIFLRNFARLARTQLISRNPYMFYFLTGRPLLGEHGHPLWNAEKFETIKSRLSAVRLVTADIESHLAGSGGGYDFMSLSDIFEYLAENESAALFESISRGLNGGGAIAYWTLLVDRKPGPNAGLTMDATLSSRLTDEDRTWFYSGFHVARK